MTVGYGVCDISPPAGITGRLGLDHTLDLLGHPVKARALCFSDADGCEILQITLETVGPTGVTIGRIRDAVWDVLRIPRDRVVVTGTHTHASPWVWELQAAEARAAGFHLLDLSWHRAVIGGSVRAAAAAVRNMHPAVLKVGAAPVRDVASNRVQHAWRGSVTPEPEKRAAPLGDIDPEVRVLAVCTADGTPEVLAANYACHPSAYGGGRTLFASPDFPYFAERAIAARWKRRVPLIYWMGCSGNINPGKFVAEGSDVEVAALGTRLADGILDAVGAAREVKGPVRLISRQERYPTGEWIEEPEDARERFRSVSDEVRDLRKAGETVDAPLLGRWRNALKRLDISVVSGGTRFPVEMFKLVIGTPGAGAAVVLLPGEWYHSHGLRLAAACSESPLFTVTAANFDLLYIPDEASLEHRDWYGVSPRMRSIGDESVRGLARDAAELAGL